jgi:hypothetical protein
MREKARRSRRVAHRNGDNWCSIIIFIGSRRKAKVEAVYVKGRLRLGVAAEDKLLSGRGLFCILVGGARIRRVKLRQRVQYVLPSRRGGNVRAGRSVEVLQLLERILVK